MLTRISVQQGLGPLGLWQSRDADGGRYCAVGLGAMVAGRVISWRWNGRSRRLGSDRDLEYILCRMQVIPQHVSHTSICWATKNCAYENAIHPWFVNALHQNAKNAKPLNPRSRLVMIDACRCLLAHWQEWICANRCTDVLNLCSNEWLNRSIPVEC